MHGRLDAQYRAHQGVDVNIAERVDLEALLEGRSVSDEDRMHGALVVVIAMITVY